MTLGGCLKSSSVRESIRPGVFAEPIQESPTTPPRSERRVQIASFIGEIQRILTYTLPPHKEYVRYDILQKPKGSYNVSSEQLASGTDLHIEEQNSESHDANRGIDANVNMLGAGAAGVQAGAQLASSDRIGHVTDMQTAHTTVRITVTGGRNGCGCFCPPSTLEVWIVTRKRDSKSFELSLAEERVQQEPAIPNRKTVQPRYMDYEKKQVPSHPKRIQGPKIPPFKV